MPRTTDVLVKGVIEVDTLAVPDLTPFIVVANELVTEICVPAGYADSRLELIETWLAAHFYAIRDPRLTSETVGPLSQSIESRVDLGLDVTRYGQMAKRLDTAGGLALLDERMKKGYGKFNLSGVTYIGKDCDE